MKVTDFTTLCQLCLFLGKLCPDQNPADLLAKDPPRLSQLHAAMSEIKVFEPAK